MKSQLSLTQGKIAFALLGFAVSFLCANLLQTLYAAANLLIAGRFCNAAGVSAVSTGSQIMLLIISIDSMLMCIVFCMSGYFSGGEKTLFNMIHGLSATFLVRASVSYFVNRMDNSTMYQMGFAAPAASVFSIIMCLAYYFLCAKKKTGGLG